MKYSKILIAAAALFALAACGEQKNANEVVVPFDSLPVAVQKTITKNAAGHKVGQVEKETDGTKVVYEAQIVGSTKTPTRVIKVCEDGKLVPAAKKTATHHSAKKIAAAAPAASKPVVTEVSWDKVPANAQKAISKHNNGQKADKVEQVTSGDKVAYVAKLSKETVKVDKDGKLLSVKKS